MGSVQANRDDAPRLHSRERVQPGRPQVASDAASTLSQRSTESFRPAFCGVYESLPGQRQDPLGQGSASR